MKKSASFHARQSDLCYARNEPMAPRVKARIDIVGEQYIIEFWVGLLEGDGTMNINTPHEYGRVNFLYFQIEMRYEPETELMLHAIAAVIGGYVAITRENEFLAGKKESIYVKWTLQDKEGVDRALEILKAYPPLTTYSRVRWDWIKRVYQKKYIEKAPAEEVYNFGLNEREVINQGKTLHLFARENYHNITYFKPWLSGFMEAESSWCARNPEKAIPGVREYRHPKNMFTLPQLGERPLLKFVGIYFGHPNPYIHRRKNGVDVLQLSKRECLKRRHDHVHANPLLGYKGAQFEVFFEILRSRRIRRSQGELITFDIPEDSLFAKIRGHPFIYAPRLEKVVLPSEEEVLPPTEVVLPPEEAGETSIKK